MPVGDRREPEADGQRERRDRERALRAARSRATKTLRAWAAAPLGSLREQAARDARLALAEAAEAKRRLDDLRSWRRSSDERPYTRRGGRGRR